MDIFEYIKRIGDKSSALIPFNEIDYTIFSNLSYINLDRIVPSNKTKLTLKEVSKIFFERYNKKELDKNIVATRNGIKLLEAMQDTERYQDLLLYNYYYSYNETKQFSALFIDLNNKETYISFEGTDELISGFKEDALLAYKFPTEGHLEAIKYVNKHISKFSRRKYIFGGHSKGGNVAIVAAMYAKPHVKKRIEDIYSFDGPGLRENEFKSLRFKTIENKVHLIVPNYSMVGMLLNNPKISKVVESTSKTIYSHSINTWLIDEEYNFIVSPLSDFSKNFRDSFNEWLTSYDDKTRKMFVEDVFDIFDRAGITSILDIKEETLKYVLKLLKESSNIDEQTKIMVRKLVDILLEYTKEYIKFKIPFLNK